MLLQIDTFPNVGCIDSFFSMTLYSENILYSYMRWIYILLNMTKSLSTTSIQSFCQSAYSDSDSADDRNYCTFATDSIWFPELSLFQLIWPNLATNTREMRRHSLVEEVAVDVGGHQGGASPLRSWSGCENVISIFREGHAVFFIPDRWVVWASELSLLKRQILLHG